MARLVTPPRDYETNLEFTYVAQIVPGWTVQPVYTSIWHPSGTGIRYPDAQVAGVRSIIRVLKEVTRPDGDMAGRVVKIGARMDGGRRRSQRVKSVIADLNERARCPSGHSARRDGNRGSRGSRRPGRKALKRRLHR